MASVSLNVPAFPSDLATTSPKFASPSVLSTAGLTDTSQPKSALSDALWQVSMPTMSPDYV